VSTSLIHRLVWPSLRGHILYCLLMGQSLAWAGPDSNPDGLRISAGAQIFKSRCVVCHGAQADGKSELAKLLKPPPANLRASTLSRQERERIVRKGGEAVGRSPSMPTWEAELTDDEIDAVLAFVATVVPKGEAR
jgi:mono/diheme cytochrome c family protein